VNPLAIRAMAEVGIDISGGKPEMVDVYLDQPWDIVVTVCDSAKESCPLFPGPVEKVHVSFPDPAGARGTEDERMAMFRSVRDAIREKLLPELARRG
jgi:arsenate reductase